MNGAKEDLFLEFCRRMSSGNMLTAFSTSQRCAVVKKVISCLNSSIFVNSRCPKHKIPPYLSVTGPKYPKLKMLWSLCPEEMCASNESAAPHFFAPMKHLFRLVAPCSRSMHSPCCSGDSTWARDQHAFADCNNERSHSYSSLHAGCWWCVSLICGFFFGFDAATMNILYGLSSVRRRKHVSMPFA